MRKFPSIRDVHLLEETMRDTPTWFETEHFHTDAYLDAIIEKPWGHEYRVYADNFYDLWKLSLHPGQKTSLHTHPRKETALLCLAGKGTVTFLGENHTIEAMDTIHIGKGVFHQTENSGSTELELIEVEVPRNKLDLIRKDDIYGRTGTQYERMSTAFEEPLCPGMGGSKIRTRCARNRYQFAVHTGCTVGAYLQRFPLFIVSLSIEYALIHHIEVFSTKNSTNSLFDQNAVYLTVEHV